MSVERRGPAVCRFSGNQEGKDEMIKASVNLQDLRRRIYVKAKTETTWRFWGLYVHVCKMETLREAYALAHNNDGAPGSDGVTFAAIEAQGVEAFLGRIRDELVQRTYVPLPARRQEIPKDGGKVRVLSIPAIRDRVVQGALKLILEPIFEADFQPGSFGYRPKRTAHEAIDRVAKAIVQQKTRVIDIDLRSYFDNVRHDRLLAKVAQRVDDADVMRLLKIMLKANGRRGVPQGGVISPLLSNLYLTEVDRMLERAKETTRFGKYTCIEYARFADDLVILIDAHPRHDWLMTAVEKRLREELADLQVEINEEKSRIVDLGRGESFGFLGFEFRRVRSRRGCMACQLHAETQETNCAAAEAQGRVSPPPVATSGSGRKVDQPGAARLGELLCGRAFQRVLQLHQRLGGKEGSAPYAARSETKGLRMDAME
jgi:RNA-directed DNA polymerase